MAALQDAAGEGRLTLTEFSDRVEAVYQSTTYGDLDSLTADLPGAGKLGGTVARRDNPESVERSRGRKGRRRCTAIMSDHVEQYVGETPSTVRVFSLMGDVTLDLREARIPGGELRISGQVIMGDLHVQVPSGVEVHIEGVNIMGDSSSQLSEHDVTGGPTIEVDVFNLMGDVGVRDGERKRKRWWQ